MEEIPEFKIDYRVKKGEYTEWHELSIKALDKSHIAVGIAERNKEIILEKLSVKMNETFYALYSVDMDTEQVNIIKNAPCYYVGDDNNCFHYGTLMTQFASHLSGEEKQFFTLHSDIEYVKKIFATEDDQSFVYRSNFIKEKPWISVKTYVIDRHIDGTPAVFIMGFCYLDSLSADKQELKSQLEDALVMAQSANRAKTTFLNNMSHDIRTPMNAIIGYTELAKTHIENKEQVLDFLDKISHSSNHLLSLINDILDMSRIESGKVTIEEKNENIFEIIEAIEDIIHVDIQTKQHDFNISYKNLKNENIICDKLRIKQILLNLLSNSIKYTSNGGHISLLVEEKKCSIPDIGTYVFTVKDNGMGISKEFLKTIYEPFTRVRNSTVSGIQGTGLGMSITKALVELMDGDIKIESELGKGTEIEIEFNFKIQKEQSSRKTKASVNAEIKEKQAVDFTGKKILLVEDNELNREIATIYLEENGFIIIPAENGQIAVDKIKEAKKGDYDIILMDIQMPVMDGYEATKQIRSLKSEFSKIPIIAMTANAFEEDKKMANECGMNDYLAKPVNLENLIKILTKVLNT